ncbi:MAG: DAK2 domain-containing protein [Chitinophagaceae bacterium]|nr:DAK2 domain-containing protein [Anaerolineae bacterium]
MVVEIKRQVCDGHGLKWLVAAGLAWLEQHQARVNQMNVFPVPDGDTGTNMWLTMQKAYDEVAQMDEPHVGIVAQCVAQGALLGARGNSGVILSQLLRGFADGLRGQDVFDAKTFAYACHKAVDASYKAVIQPVEGTILTVAREATVALTEYTAANNDLDGAFDRLVEAARAALEKTPDMMPVLKQAGVVDSGGAGLLYILEGMQRLLHGETVTFSEKPLSDSTTASSDWQEALKPGSAEGYGYDVQFLMHGTRMDVEVIRETIDAMGWSTLVVGDSKLIKVHVHVNDPGEPLSYAIRSGALIDDIVVENMQLQYQRYVENRLAREGTSLPQVEGVAVITVASGEGLETLFYEGLGAARVIAGGQTMNPSAGDFLAAIDSLSNEHIVLLPNNKNILMAAQQAAALARGKQVHVVPTTTMPQGINALLAVIDIKAAGDVTAVLDAMVEAIGQIITGEITISTRDVTLESLTVQQGQIIGLLEDKLVTAGDSIFQVAYDLLTKARADEYELITVYYGDTMSEAQAQALIDELSGLFKTLDFEIVAGGQPLYPVILSIE